MYRTPLYWQITLGFNMYVFYKDRITQITQLNIDGSVYLWNHPAKDTKPLLKNMLQNDNWTRIRIGEDYL